MGRRGRLGRGNAMCNLDARRERAEIAQDIGILG